MGYTHYWEFHVPLKSNQWTQLTSFVKKSVDLSGLDLEVEIDDDNIIINGVDDLGYEDFILTKNEPKWDCCKTAAKPYDVVVVAILHFMETEFGEEVFRWSSDGREEDGDFDDGRTLAAIAIQ